MCAIVGYAGKQPAAPILLEGLRRLDGRSYDSAGLATVHDGRIDVRKTVGQVRQLEAACESRPPQGCLGIAHTRWATHGEPSPANAHPLLDQSGRIALVHNGVVENHAAVREFLTAQGVEFRSTTDSESLVQLIGFFYAQTGNLLESVRSALREVTGTFGIAVACTEAPHTLIAARRGSPVIVGVGQDEYIVASDVAAIAPLTSQAVSLSDHEIVTVGPDGLRASTIDAKPVRKDVGPIETALSEIELGRFEYHMLKEIHEQPESLRNATRGRLHVSTGEITLGGLDPCRRELPRCRRVLLFGCGTAWHAALVGEYLIEELAGLPATVEYASELRYRNPIIEEGTLALAISQSGETTDTLAALKEVRTRGALALGVVNAVGSSIANATDAGVYLHAGPEIGVASTKAFTAQIAVLAMIAADLGRQRHLAPERLGQLIEELTAIPQKVEQALYLDSQIRDLAGRLAPRDNWLYLGRGVNFPVALEGALKLKEVSYIHAEGLPAAEMKHGPIAMIDEGMPVVVLATRDHTYPQVLANMQAARERGGHVIAVATAGDCEIARLADDVLYVPATPSLLAPLVTAVPLQLLAFHAAVVRGRDVDRPRSLAKSVVAE